MPGFPKERMPPAALSGNVVDLRIKKNWPYGGPLLKSGTNRLGMSALRKNIMMAQ
jgi:hypothetical protein